MVTILPWPFCLVLINLLISEALVKEVEPNFILFEADSRFCIFNGFYLFIKVTLKNSILQWIILGMWSNKQSGTKPNLVAKIWPPNLVTICAWLPKLVANVSSQFHRLINTGLAVGSLDKWLPINVANTSKTDKFEWFIARRLEMAPSDYNHL